MDQFYQLGSDLVQRQDEINIAGLDRSLGHAEILRRRLILSDDLATLLLDDLYPDRAVTISTREHDGDGILFVDLRHGREQRLGRGAGMMNFFRGGRGKLEAAAFSHEQVMVGRGYKDTRLAEHVARSGLLDFQLSAPA